MSGLLVIGRSGQLAQELARLAPQARFVGRDEADLSRPDGAASLIRDLRPAAVVNAAAWTAVDRAEDSPEAAMLVNADAPGVIAAACAAVGAVLVHVSTDYVFDGSGARPWRETDTPAPLGVYGASKLMGEKAVEASGATAAVLRTSWVFSAHGSNFVKTMLRLGAERDSLSVVADQFGGPTPADDLARACLTVANGLGTDPARRGVYHFSGAPDVSWAGFAAEIFARAGLDCAVSEIATADYPTPAQRPLNSRLDCTAIGSAFGLARPDWRAGLDRVLAELRAQ